MSRSAQQVWRLERGAPGYPGALLDLAQGAPQRLYGLGRRELVSGLAIEHAVTIVGARRATPYGLQVAEELGRLLAAAGLVVVSGMAHGIDAAAHRGALAGRGETIAVLAGGPDVAYPPSQRRLHRRIRESGGALVAEAAPGVRPGRWSFPARNRIMAALAKLTVVVEAGEQSGSRHTTDRAQELDRMVGAVPGPVTSRMSAGPNALLADGALVVRDAQDVLDLLLGVGAQQVRAAGPPLDPELAPVLRAIEEGAATADRIVLDSGLSAPAVAVALSRLELLGYACSEGLGRYARTVLTPPKLDG